MSKLFFTILAAVGVLSACTTDTGLSYSAQNLNVAGQSGAQRVTCSGLFESQNSCVSKAARICEDRQVIVVQALDNPQLRPGGSRARQLDFQCAAATKPAA
jgi:hypothetical protein